LKIVAELDAGGGQIRRYAGHNTGESVAAGGQLYSTIVRLLNELGMPDGMCLGPDGHLWIAHCAALGTLVSFAISRLLAKLGKRKR